MTKRGQITLFILIGIIILSAILIIIILQKNEANNKTPLLSHKLDAEQVKVYVDSCIDQVSLPGIYLLAYKGGYIYSFPETLDTEYEPIAYHFKNNINISPTKQFMQKELSKFVENSLPLCLNNFKPFDYYQFELGNINANTIISNDNIYINVHYPITIISKNSKTTLSDFSVNFPISLGRMLNVKEDILSELINDNQVNISSINSYEFDIKIFQYNKNTFIYNIINNDNKIIDSPLLFNFAVEIGSSA